MAEEEKIIEINIALDKPYVIVFLLIIIVFEAGYIGYLHFYKSGEAENANIDLEEPDKEIDVIKEIPFNFSEPKTFDELKADLFAIGVEKIIDLEVQDWHGKHFDANYTEALRLAKEAAFVCVNENIVAFMMYIDGEFLIWFPS
ncbi:MAG: hypothetical protein OEZ25_04055 [Candidatus Bathyarchaeota archaeon]|nr:hypothetical protein [Candidatus Bathyarchaeota archaeon]